MEKEWKIIRHDRTVISQLMQAFNLSTISAKILAARGCTTVESARNVLYVSEKNIHDPFLMHGMEQAVQRIKEAIEKREKILVYTDYDMDGISSGAVLMTTLKDLGADVVFMIPNRFKHGYGPHVDLFREAHAMGIQLIITADNGISGVEPIRVAKELGMDVIVTDHHEAGEVLPNADIILHPRVPEGHYPFGELAGVGVAFKLAHALYGTFPEQLLKFVVLGTIADIVNLVDENRYMVKRGLELLRTADEYWVKAMCAVSGVEQKKIDEDTIGFYFGPRFNAIGRLGEASPGVELLLSKTATESVELAEQLNDANKERKKIVEDITNESIAMIEENAHIKNAKVLVVAKEGWNPGVVGIVASRLVERYYKPVLVLDLNPETGMAKGSARSIEGFHFYEALCENRELVPHFGGHPMAAGMTFPMQNVDALRMGLDRVAKERVPEECWTPVVKIDASLRSSEITVAAIEELKLLSPFGAGFDRPKFAIEHARIVNKRQMGSENAHLKLEIQDGIDKLDAVSFGDGHLFDFIKIGSGVSIVGDIQVNEWRGNKNPQLMVDDLKFEESILEDLRHAGSAELMAASINMETTSVIAFNPETKEAYDHLFGNQITLYVAKQTLEDRIVLLDLPRKIEDLRLVLEKQKYKKIFYWFYGVQAQAFDSMPDRALFGYFYKYVCNTPGQTRDALIKTIVQAMNCTERVARMMFGTCLELGLIEEVQGIVQAVPNPEKKDLTRAGIYQDFVVQLNNENRLMYGTKHEIEDYLKARMSR